MVVDVLSDRDLNRATLARQMLLERSSLAPTAAIEHLVGLQAQNPLDPYLALWSRLDGFDLKRWAACWRSGDWCASSSCEGPSTS